MSKVNKTVRAYSIKLTDEQFEAFDKLFNEYAKVENEMLKRFCGIQYMSDICKWSIIRDKIRAEQNKIKENRKTDDNNNNESKDSKKSKESKNSKNNRNNKNNKNNKNNNCNEVVKNTENTKNDENKLTTPKLLTEKYEIQGWHWVMATKHACSTLHSMWSNLGSRLKTLVRDNKNLTPEMRAYCYYILSAIPYWQKVLLREPFDKIPEKLATLMSKLTNEELKKCNSYICRSTRTHKPYPEVKNARCMMYDVNMYKFTDDCTVKIMSNIPKEAIEIKLCGPFCYKKTGDIQLIFDRDKKRIEIHKLIKARATQTTSKIEIGPDKGFATLLSCYSGNEYGYKFGELVTERSDYLNERNTNRNIIFDRQRKLKDEISELDKAINKTTDDSKRIPLIRKKKEQERRLQMLEANNIGNKKFNRE